MLGLSLGFTGAILIMLWVWNEFDYDRFHEQADNIYLVINKNTDDQGNSVEYVESPAPMANYLVNNFPEINKAVRIEYFYRGGLIQKGTDFFKEKGAAADASFFDIFSLNFINGDKSSVFNKPGSIVISEKMARRYYGDGNPVGEELKIKGYGDSFKTVKITGVFTDIPDNSSIKLDFLIPFSLEEKSYTDNWKVSIYATFILLDKACDLNLVNKKISSIYEDVIGDNHFSSYLFPLVRLHLHSEIPFFNNSRKGNIRLLYLMIFIAILILLIAIINYINLSTARIINKTRDISIKKILGISRWQIISDSFIEASFFSIVSFQIAVILIEIMRPAFNTITGQIITLNYFDPQIIMVVVIIILVTSVISAIYPLINANLFKPISYLRNGFYKGETKHILRKLLVIVQFSISIILIIYSSVIIKQINFIYSKQLGFDKENVLIINSSDLKEAADVFKTNILKHTNISSVSIGESPLGGGWPDQWSWEGKDGFSKLAVNRISADPDYLKTLDIKLLKGRFFTEVDSVNTFIVINKKFADLIGSDDVLGKKIYFREESFEIIGVTDNFYSHHFSTEVKPTAFFKEPSSGMLIKLRNNDYSTVVPYLKSEFAKLVTDRAFEFTTLEKQFDNLYVTELRIGRMFSYFSFLAIFISCLGLFATSIFITEQKTKEIGIRKTMGATSFHILKRLNYDYLKLVALAYFIACPIVYYLTQKWLRDFVYKTEHLWKSFLLSGMLAILIAIVAISWQTIKAARRNPVESLRYE